MLSDDEDVIVDDRHRAYEAFHSWRVLRDQIDGRSSGITFGRQGGPETSVPAFFIGENVLRLPENDKNSA